MSEKIVHDALGATVETILPELERLQDENARMRDRAKHAISATRNCPCGCGIAINALFSSPQSDGEK